MAVDVLMPKLNFSMSEGMLVEWLVKNGDPVEAGTPLFAIEAEKATQEIEAPASGTLAVHAEAGGTYEVGALLGRIE